MVNYFPKYLLKTINEHDPFHKEVTKKQSRNANGRHFVFCLCVTGHSLLCSEATDSTKYTNMSVYACIHICIYTYRHVCVCESRLSGQRSTEHQIMLVYVARDRRIVHLQHLHTRGLYA